MVSKSFALSHYCYLYLWSRSCLELVPSSPLLFPAGIKPICVGPELNPSPFPAQPPTLAFSRMLRASPMARGCCPSLATPRGINPSSCCSRRARRRQGHGASPGDAQALPAPSRRGFNRSKAPGPHPASNPVPSAQSFHSPPGEEKNCQRKAALGKGAIAPLPGRGEGFVTRQPQSPKSFHQPPSYRHTPRLS